MPPRDNYVDTLKKLELKLSKDSKPQPVFYVETERSEAGSHPYSVTSRVSKLAFLNAVDEIGKTVTLSEEDVSGKYHAIYSQSGNLKVTTHVPESIVGKVKEVKAVGNCVGCPPNHTTFWAILELEDTTCCENRVSQHAFFMLLDKVDKFVILSAATKGTNIFQMVDGELEKREYLTLEKELEEEEVRFREFVVGVVINISISANSQNLEYVIMLELKQEDESSIEVRISGQYLVLAQAEDRHIAESLLGKLVRVSKPDKAKGYYTYIRTVDGEIGEYS